VAAVTAGSPAAFGGVQQGDLLLSIEGRTIRGVGDLMAGLPRAAIGTELRLRLLRHNEILRVVVRPVAAPTAVA
ncbi:MAG TPA: PDZ domain-containing protein, partial [Planctomycetota bacterium]